MWAQRSQTYIYLYNPFPFFTECWCSRDEELLRLTCHKKYHWWSWCHAAVAARARRRLCLVLASVPWPQPGGGLAPAGPGLTTEVVEAGELAGAPSSRAPAATLSLLGAHHNTQHHSINSTFISTFQLPVPESLISSTLSWVLPRTLFIK